MAVPTLFTLTLPILQIINDKKEHTTSEVVEKVSLKLGLNEEDRTEVIPGRTETRLKNRASWATTELKNAGLLERTGIAKIRITEAGVNLLKTNPEKLDQKILKPLQLKNPDKPLAKEHNKTTEEILEAKYQNLQQDFVEQANWLKQDQAQLQDWLAKYNQTYEKKLEQIKQQTAELYQQVIQLFEEREQITLERDGLTQRVKELETMLAKKESEQITTLTKQVQKIQQEQPVLNNGRPNNELQKIQEKRQLDIVNKLSEAYGLLGDLETQLMISSDNPIRMKALNGQIEQVKHFARGLQEEHSHG